MGSGASKRTTPAADDADRVFDELDLNQDGKLSINELIGASQSYGALVAAEWPEAKIRQTVAKADKDNDGFIDRKEWKSALIDLSKGSAGKVPYAGQPTSTSAVWAKGVGSAFEFINERNQWQSITDKYTIEQLGRLICYNGVNEVTYKQHAGSTNSYRTTFGGEGVLTQTNVSTGMQRPIRLVPFFFEYEDGQRWSAVTDHPAIVALTALLASSRHKRYVAPTPLGQQSYEAVLRDECGLIAQFNLASGKERRIRPTPVGPDGEQHFEYLETKRPSGSDWNRVAGSCVKQLAAVAAGRGDTHYRIGEWTYHAWLHADGFVRQRNQTTGKERLLRPAPWLGHGGVRRADSTDGYIPQAAPPQLMQIPQPEPLVAMGVPMMTSTTTTTTTTTTQTVQTAMPVAMYATPTAALPLAAPPQAASMAGDKVQVTKPGDPREGQWGTVVSNDTVGLQVQFEDGAVEGFQFASIGLPAKAANFYQPAVVDMGTEGAPVVLDQ